MKTVKFLPFLFIFFIGSVPARAESVFSEQLNYLKISSPNYPKIARQNGWEGTVILKALVEKDGHCENAVIEKSSGHKILDESALEAVKKWKFKPAAFGEEPYASIARVPVQFVLADEN